MFKILSLAAAALLALAPVSEAASKTPLPTAKGAGLVVDVASILGGRLIITGTANKANQLITIKGTEFNTFAAADKTFAFSIRFQPTDCSVRLKRADSRELPLQVANCGKQGKAGPKGETGPKGDTGPAGPQGEIGPIGPQGETGPIGPQGETGPIGLKGENGPRGPIGLTGPQGPRGLQGVAGPTGSFQGTFFAIKVDGPTGEPIGTPFPATATSRRTSEGVYRVAFDRGIFSCFVTATILDNLGVNVIKAFPIAGEIQILTLSQQSDFDFSNTDRDFTLMVLCP